MSMHDSRSGHYNITIAFAFTFHTFSTLTEWRPEVGVQKKKSFTLSSFQSRTSGAVPDQKEELAVRRAEPSLFGSVQKELGITMC